MKRFVTGAAGFIGSNYVRAVLAGTDDEVTIFDALTYAGNLESVRDVLDDRRCRFVHADICDQDAVLAAMDGHDVVVLERAPEPGGMAAARGGGRLDLMVSRQGLLDDDAPPLRH